MLNNHKVNSYREQKVFFLYFFLGFFITILLVQAGITTPQIPHYPSASAKARSVMMVLLHFHRIVDNNSVVTRLPLTPQGEKLNMKETRSVNEVLWRQHISLYLTKFSMSTKRKGTGNIPSYCRTGSLKHPHTNFHEQKYHTPLVHSASYLSRVSAPFPAPLICTHLSKCHCLFCLCAKEKQKAKITSTSHSTRRCSQLRTPSP